MALFKTRSAAVYGIDAHLIDVEVDMFSSGSARDSVMVGMPDTAVRESRERIKSALINSGRIPRSRCRPRPCRPNPSG
jgi:magnesium chelatase family protein